MLFAIKWKLHANNPSLFSCSKITTWILWHSDYVFLRLKRKALRRRLSREKHARSRHIFKTLNLSTECCVVQQKMRDASVTVKHICIEHVYIEKQHFYVGICTYMLRARFWVNFALILIQIFFMTNLWSHFLFFYFTWFVGFFQFFHIKTEVKIWNNEV